jgi:hypothetical protein
MYLCEKISATASKYRQNGRLGRLAACDMFRLRQALVTF